MNKRNVNTLIIFLIIIIQTSMAPLILAQNNVHPHKEGYQLDSMTRTTNSCNKKILVDDDFGSDTKGWGVTHFNHIQDGINAAESGSVVYVFAGVYLEHLVVDKSIQLLGEDKLTTIIDGEESGTVVTITADNVTIREFTIQNSGRTYFDCGIGIQASRTDITHNIITYSRVGVYITWYDIFFKNTITKNLLIENEIGIIVDNQYYSHHVISENIIMNNSETGIVLIYSDENTVCNNIITYNDYYGISILNSDYHRIINNTITNNHRDGIYLETSCENMFSSNIVTDNSQSGIHLYSLSDQNTILDNTFKNNQYGIYIPRYLWDCSFNNNIYHNNFINNIINAFDQGPNFWDNGYPSGGNYWSDHVCSGNPSDGTQPYHVTYDADDSYPFQNPNGWRITKPTLTN